MIFPMHEFPRNVNLNFLQVAGTQHMNICNIKNRNATPSVIKYQLLEYDLSFSGQVSLLLNVCLHILFSHIVILKLYKNACHDNLKLVV